MYQSISCYLSNHLDRKQRHLQAFPTITQAASGTEKSDSTLVNVC